MNLLDGWPYLVGYSYSLVVGSVLIARLSRTLWKSIGLDFQREANERHRHQYLIVMVGICERTIYTASWLLGKPEFIPLWLGFKLAGQWKGFEHDKSGRISLNAFQIGSSFSLGYGVLGGALVGWINNKNWQAAIGIPIALMAANLAFLYYARRVRRSRHMRRLRVHRERRGHQARAAISN